MTPSSPAPNSPAGLNCWTKRKSFASLHSGDYDAFDDVPLGREIMWLNLIFSVMVLAGLETQIWLSHAISRISFSSQKGRHHVKNAPTLDLRTDALDYTGDRVLERYLYSSQLKPYMTEYRQACRSGARLANATFESMNLLPAGLLETCVKLAFEAFPGLAL